MPATTTTEAVLAALDDELDVTTAELAAATGLSRSTVGKALVALENARRARRTRGGRERGRHRRTAGQPGRPPTMGSRVTGGCAVGNCARWSPSTCDSTPRSSTPPPGREGAWHGRPARSATRWTGWPPTVRSSRPASRRDGSATAADLSPVALVSVQREQINNTRPTPRLDPMGRHRFRHHDANADGGSSAPPVAAGAVSSG